MFVCLSVCPPPSLLLYNHIMYNYNVLHIGTIHDQERISFHFHNGDEASWGWGHKTVFIKILIIQMLWNLELRNLVESNYVNCYMVSEDLVAEGVAFWVLDSMTPFSLKYSSFST